MNTPDTTLEIQTLGRFAISVAGKPVATAWPDEMLKVLFCSLLSPLDLYFTWDRLCRAMLGEPATQVGMRHLEKCCVLPLKRFLIKELGFNPLLAGPDGLRIDQHGIHIDAMEFYSSVLEGLRLLSLTNRAAAFEQFTRANILYAGSYLPDMPGKIIANTRNDLEALYRTAVMDGLRPVAERTRLPRTPRYSPPQLQSVA